MNKLSTLDDKKEKLEKVEELLRELDIRYTKGTVSINAQDEIRLNLKEILKKK